MNNPLLISFIALTTVFSFSQKSIAQQRKALGGNASAKGSPSAMAAKPSSANVSFRLMANYDYTLTNPKELNDNRALNLWNGTTATQGKFGTMNAYSLGAGYMLGMGFIGGEFNSGSQELSATTITPTTTTAQDTLNFQSVYLTYDWVFNVGTNQSYELGLGIGQAIKFQYHWKFNSGAATEEVIWEATPIVYKVRANYNYHLSKNIRFRLGATFENLTSSSLKADSNHPTISTGITSGQTLKTTTGSDQKIDLSGFRVNTGLVIAF